MTKAGPVWTGDIRFNPEWLDQPLRWRKPRRIFVVAHGDLFHENVPDEWIDWIFAIMALAPQHVFQVLTKRPERMLAYMTSAHHHAPPVGAIAELYTSFPHLAVKWPFDVDRAMGVGSRGWPLPNVWCGVSVEDQTRADERIPHLIETPAAVHWISAEPLLAPIDFRSVPGFNRVNLSLHKWWVVVGGESGPGARPMHPDWARSLVDQCKSAGVAVFVKQLSSGGPRPIKDLADFPADLQIQEMPETQQ